MWHSAAPNIDNKLRNTLKAGSNQNIVLPAFLELIAGKYQSHLQIYTDGSKDNSFCGAGVVIPHESHLYHLPNLCSVFSAEAFALKTAVSKVNEHENAIIFTDSASCLDALRSGRSKHPWIQSIEKMIESRKVTFSWIPGHCGIVGNELADKLAKNARNQPLLDIPIPAQDAVQAIKKEIWTTWEAEWFQSQEQLRQIKQTPRKHPDRTNASDQRILTRLRIGHSRLTHSYILNHSSPPICVWCGVQTTIKHILVDCRGYTQIRSTCGITGSLAEILEHKSEKEKAVLKFIRECKLYSEM